MGQPPQGAERPLAQNGSDHHPLHHVLERHPTKPVRLSRSAHHCGGFGGSKVARGQLERVLEASEWDNVTVRALPFSAGGFPHAGASVTYMYGVVPRLDTVQLDTPTGVTFLDGETHLANYRRILDRTEGLSLAPADTRDFIHAIAQRL